VGDVDRDLGVVIAFNRWVSTTVSRVNESLVLIYTTLDNTPCSESQDFIRSATGFAIDRDVVVTVAHLNPVEKLCLADLSGRRFYGEVLAIDNRWDIAFIKTEEELKPLSLSQNLPPIGSIVVVGGIPYGLLRSYYALGIVSGYKVNTFINGKRIEGLIMLSAPTTPGMSGGPVIDIHGDVVGMLVANAMNLNEFTLAVPGKRILYSYTMLKKLGKVVHPSLGLKVVEGLTKEVKGLTISSIHNKLVIELCGIDLGDILISVNGSDVETLEDLWDALDRAAIDCVDFLKIKFYDHSDKKVRECVYPLSLETTSYSTKPLL
jgi:S1-C subfamily serine protease